MNQIQPSRDSSGRFKSKPATYAIYGMTEYLAMIPCGAICIPLHFTDGTITGYGVRPATATVDDPQFARYIEASPLFKQGKIVRISSAK